LACSQGRERKGRRQSAADSTLLRRRPASRGKKKGRGEGRLTGGAQASATAKEKEKREGEVGRRGTVSWAGRPGWADGEQVRFSFFSFSFSNHFSFQIQIKLFQTFSQEFYKLFRNHTSNQKPCKPSDDAQSLVVSKFIKLCLIF
jgi:hypothetical protein